MVRSRSRVKKELDIVKFIQRQRQNTFAIMSLLNWRQRFFIDNMSQLTIRESSNFEETSCDDELENTTNGSKNSMFSSHVFTRAMLAS